MGLMSTISRWRPHRTKKDASPINQRLDIIPPAADMD
jgi:hypothetical protein